MSINAVREIPILVEHGLSNPSSGPKFREGGEKIKKVKIVGHLEPT